MWFEELMRYLRGEGSFVKKMSKEIAPWLVETLGTTPAEAEKAFEEIIRGSTVEKPFDRIFRVEVGVKWDSDESVVVKLMCAIERGPQAHVGTATVVLDWDQLPTSMRQDLIAKSGTEQYYLLYERALGASSPRGEQP